MEQLDYNSPFCLFVELDVDNANGDHTMIEAKTPLNSFMRRNENDQPENRGSGNVKAGLTTSPTPPTNDTPANPRPIRMFISTRKLSTPNQRSAIRPISSSKTIKDWYRGRGNDYCHWPCESGNTERMTAPTRLALTQGYALRTTNKRFRGLVYFRMCLLGRSKSSAVRPREV